MSIQNLLKKIFFEIIFLLSDYVIENFPKLLKPKRWFFIQPKFRNIGNIFIYWTIIFKRSTLKVLNFLNGRAILSYKTNFKHLPLKNVQGVKETQYEMKFVYKNEQIRSTCILILLFLLFPPFFFFIYSLTATGIKNIYLRQL